jgi:hypothetical protein
VALSPGFIEALPDPSRLVIVVTDVLRACHPSQVSARSATAGDLVWCGLSTLSDYAHAPVETADTDARADRMISVSRVGDFIL